MDVQPYSSWLALISSCNTAATERTLDPPSAVASSSGTSATSPLIPSSCLVWYQLPPHTTLWQDDRKDRSSPVFSTCMLCYAYMSFLFQWLSWRHSSDGSWILDYGSMSSRHSPSLEQRPSELLHPDVGMSPGYAQAEGTNLNKLSF